MSGRRGWSSRLEMNRSTPSPTASRSTNHRPGQIVWRDDLGVTCRRWNWRQCTRTRLTLYQNALFIFDGLAPSGTTQLREAAEDLGRFDEASFASRILGLDMDRP